MEYERPWREASKYRQVCNTKESGGFHVVAFGHGRCIYILTASRSEVPYLNDNGSGMAAVTEEHAVLLAAES